MIDVIASEPAVSDKKVGKMQEISGFTPEQQAQVPLLETKTDEVFRLRTQLAQFYKTNAAFLLPTVPGMNRKEEPILNRPKISELYDTYQQKSDTEKSTYLESVIDWEKVAAEAAKSTSDGSERKKAQRLRKFVVKNAFERAMFIYGELKEKDGYWRGEDRDSFTQDDTEVKNYYKMRFGEFGRSVKRFDELTQEAEELEELRDMMLSDSDFGATPQDLDKLEEEYTQKMEKIHTFATSSPEAYYYVLGRQLKDARDTFNEEGTIVETPYVKAKMARISDLVRQGRPVFIHGELGSGKTELAKHLARTEFSKKHLARWEMQHPSPVSLWEAKHPRPDDAYEALRWDLLRKAMLESDLAKPQKEWVAKRTQEAEPLVIWGNKNLDQQQVLGERGIRRAEVPSPDEQAQIIQSEWERFRLQLGEGEGEEQVRKLEEVHKQAWLKSFESPVETQALLGPLLVAMKEGRPLIIDEMNAIPHHLLIVMNDLLLRKVGDTITPPFAGVAPFTIQEGYCVQATGNYKPEDGIMYIGRQPLDAAFLSRFGIVSYDYLPMQRTLEVVDMSPEKLREHRIQNELFHMMVARFLNPDLSITLPKESFDQLTRLAYVARIIEDVFSGKNVGDAFNATVNGAAVRPQDVLKENVLSIRHLLPLLDRWKKEGYKRNLEDYLFLDYISRSDARPEEKAYIYSQLKTHGDFFTTAAGWPTTDQKDMILSYPIEEKMYGVDRLTGMRQAISARTADLQFYAVTDVITQLYGPAPERTHLPKDHFEKVTATKKVSSEEKDEETLERERVLAVLDSTFARLAQEGFDVFAKPEQG